MITKIRANCSTVSRFPVTRGVDLTPEGPIFIPGKEITFIMGALSIRRPLARRAIFYGLKAINGLRKPKMGDFNGTSDYIEYQGFTAEHHNVISEDGFAISVFRIPGEGSPILLQHGLFASSDTWVLQGSEHDLAFMLAERGYDVWIANYRGNTYSKSHLRFSPKSSKFWNFSFHEMGVYDMPAVVDYILETTKRGKMDVVGHSLGCTIFLVMCSVRPEYNNKIRSFIALAPGVFFNVTQQTTIERLLSKYGPYIKYMHQQFGMNEFFAFNLANTKMMASACRMDSKFYPICLYVVQNVLGFSGVKQHFKPLADFLVAAPHGVSYKTLAHLAQFMHTGKLCHFNYGKKNSQIYGQKSPPEYDLNLVTAPVILAFSNADIHVFHGDVLTLASKLPNVIREFRIEKPSFNHVDFCLGVDAKDVIYENILETLDGFEENELISRDRPNPNPNSNTDYSSYE